MEPNIIPQRPAPIESEEYRPKHLQQLTLIQELTGSDENDIIETALHNYTWGN